MYYIYYEFFSRKKRFSMVDGIITGQKLNKFSMLLSNNIKIKFSHIYVYKRNEQIKFRI